jgi:hypothetical protein
MREKQELSPKFNVTVTHVDPSKKPTVCQGNLPGATDPAPGIERTVHLTTPLATSLASLYHQDKVRPNASCCFSDIGSPRPPLRRSPERTSCPRRAFTRG